MSDTHIALITPWHRQGGIATYSERFVDSLVKTEVEVTPIPVKNTGSLNPLEFTDLVSRISAEADIVHVQFEAGLFGKLGISGVGAPMFFHSLGRVNKPIVTTLHEVHRKHVHRGTAGDYFLRGRDFVIERLALRVSDAIVVHTRKAEKILGDRHGEGDNVHRMLHPTNKDVAPIPEEDAKDKLDVEDNLLLTFGFVEEKKQYQDVIRALPKLPDVTYVIAGGLRDGEGERVVEECQELATDLEVADKVHFTGYVDEEEVPVVFSAADAVVLPYNRVSQSGVVNDALAYQRPVVASSLSAFEELRDEFKCLLTYCHQSDLQQQLERALYNDEVREELVTKAREYTETITWERFAENSIDVYTAFLNSRPCSP